MLYTTYQRYWYRSIRTGNSFLTWSTLVILLLYISGGVTQIEDYEGSVPYAGSTREERFVKSDDDEQVISSSEAAQRLCVRKEFSGGGFKIRGILYNTLYICPNGQIKFTNGFYQNYPFNYGSSGIQQDEDPSVSPYWSRVNVRAFGAGPRDSKVRFASYHKDRNPSPVVFDKVNQDVAEFTGRSFIATWVSVVTYENIRPADSTQRNYGGLNTFQAVFASDESTWYLMYNYDDIDWSVAALKSELGRYVDEPGLPVTGWNAGRRGFFYRNGEEYENLPESGTVNAQVIDDYTGNLGKGRWIFAMSPNTAKTPGTLCYDWFISASPVVPDSALQCPPTERQAHFDARFRRRDRFRRICYVKINPQIIRARGLRCCYRRFGGPLLRNLREPGGFLSANPLRFNVQEDDDAYENCCVLSNFCSAYASRRPRQFGRGYRPRSRRRGWGYGDPHYSNLDRLNYTFNGCGDYMFLLTNDGKIQIQVRFTQAIGAGLGTVMSAVLFKVEGIVPIQINHNSNGGPGMLININGSQYDDYDNLLNNSHVVGDFITISRNEENAIRLVTGNDTFIVVTRESNNLVILISLDRERYFGMTQGLLGNWSDTVEDDFNLPNGTNLGYPLTDSQIHFDFGESWRLAPEQNFIINTTADANFFCPDNYAPIFISNFTFPNNSIANTASDVCGKIKIASLILLRHCSPSFGQTTKNSAEALEEENSISENSAPTFESDDVVFNFTLGEVFEYTISATDEDGDSLVFPPPDLPPGATLEINETSITFRWRVNTTQAFNLSFLVQDANNGSSLLVPAITVCACQNNGTCVQPATTLETRNITFNQHQVLACDCEIGFIGEFCETTRDFCQTQSGSPCHPLVTCTNTPKEYQCGPCPAGYTGLGEDCADIDECQANLHNCEMLCDNSAGSFVCDCMPGYRLNADKKSCDDIDECTTAHDCQQNCINTNGSFTCGCNTNFKVDPTNSKNCVPVTSCPSGHSCQHVCAIDGVSGNQICSCNPGYTVDPDDVTRCIDINECNSTTNLCNQLCTNFVGGFNCSCTSGYEKVPGSQTTCQDVDECIITFDGNVLNNCNTSNGGEVCVNLIGTFRCECNRNLGFFLIDGVCRVPDDGKVVVVEPEAPPVSTRENINSSVQLRLHNINLTQYDRPKDITFRRSIADALNAYCNANSQRRIECGLTSHGFAFTESNVFRLSNGTTKDNGDLLVSYYALYPNGTRDDGRLSVPLSVLLSAITDGLDAISAATKETATVGDVDECSLGIDDCGQTCNNTLGSFSCSCHQGYQLDSDKKSCTDIEECDIDNGGCGHGCNNTVGSFKCFCYVGYQLQNDMKSCADIDECDLNECAHGCNNTQGSFNCFCRDGYKLENVKSCTDIDECLEEIHNCNDSGNGEICRNILNGFVCECNRTIGFGLIDGICQALNGTVEPPPVPRNTTDIQNTNAVELIIPNSRTEEYGGRTDSQLRAAIARALNSYCNANDSRRRECGLPGSGFEFSENNIHRIQSDPSQDGSDTSVSFYALYPNGVHADTNIPVPQITLSNAIKENLNDIRQSTGLDALTLVEDTLPSSDDKGVDWPLILGLSLAGALLVLSGIAAICMCCCKGAAKKPNRNAPMRFVYDAYRHRPRRRLNVADMEPSFGTFHSMSGETYSGFDEDGLPVDIQTDYDGLSRQARTISHVPTASQGSFR
ncbi:LOW QUALITY PROTEIN: mucin-like protein [Dendronephthya gigantea]|uniref:LOW QUALITY PROTEIN: mucin-like protein n=1 Tax=Dendronephthya gigantea TaxID=151771 RepID=UPI00106DA362|nr:LOW QUALITY PROTEIN: mucin-like protein [Dendronephthya gigantea]